MGWNVIKDLRKHPLFKDIDSDFGFTLSIVFILSVKILKIYYLYRIMDVNLPLQFMIITFLELNSILKKVMEMEYNY